MKSLGNDFTALSMHLFEAEFDDALSPRWQSVCARIADHLYRTGLWLCGEYALLAEMRG